MKTAGVLIDAWKLSIFEKHLKEAGYSYEIAPWLTPECLILQVQFEWVAKLQPVIQAAQKECAETKKDK